MNVLLTAYPRLHLTLLDLGGITPRKYGGAGLTLAGPTLRLSAKQDERWKLVGFDRLDAESRREITDLLRRLTDSLLCHPARLELLQALPQHVGLGSKTATLLSIIRAVTAVNGHAASRAETVNISGRGGASGVGVATFFRGGFVTDAGHPYDGTKRFLPSHGRKPQHAPPLICRLPTPPYWRFHLFLPAGYRLAGESEVTFFQHHTPLPESEVLSAIALVYHGLAPAIATSDLQLLHSSLQHIHNIGFKSRELKSQSPAVRDLYLKLSREPAVAVGMSSLGPVLYCVEDGRVAIRSAHFEALAQAAGSTYLGCYKPRNQGHRVSHI